MTLAEHGITITQTMTTPSRPGKQPRPVWAVSCPAGYEEAMVAAGGRKYGRTWSFWSDPTETLEAALQEVGRTSYAERLEAKRERAEDRAERYSEYAQHAQQRSGEAFASADAIMQNIPLGQPILVGHHSEGHARADRKRIDHAMDKACEESKKAEYWEHRAKSAEGTAKVIVNPAFAARRLKEAEVELRLVERRLSGQTSFGELDPAYRAQLEASRLEYQERVTHWREQLTQAGGVRYSKANVKAGDEVLIRGLWCKVEKANPTTVSAKTDIVPWPLKYPYEEIQDHKPANPEG